MWCFATALMYACKYINDALLNLIIHYRNSLLLKNESDQSAYNIYMKRNLTILEELELRILQYNYFPSRVKNANNFINKKLIN